MTSPTPVYNPNVPQLKNNLAQSQMDFLANFSSLYTAFSQNHVALDAASQAGNHTYIQLFKQGNGPQTGADEISVYTKNVSGQTEQIFLKYPNGTEFQFTNYQIYSIPEEPTQIKFFTFLPGRIIVYFGTSIPGNFPPGFPPAIYFDPFVAKNIITINICPLGPTPTLSPSVSLQAATPQGVYQAASLKNLAANFSFYYIAMANI